MNNCVCGRPVRLGGMKVRVDRKNGVFHHIVHMDGTPPCVPGDWTTVMFKPYPKRNEDKDWHKMICRWEALTQSRALSETE